MSTIRNLSMLLIVLVVMLSACAATPTEEDQNQAATVLPLNLAPTTEALVPPVVQPQPTQAAPVSTLPDWVPGAVGFSNSAESRKLEPIGGTFALDVNQAFSPEDGATRINFVYQPDGNGGFNLTHDLGVLMLDPSMLSNEIKVFLWSPTADGPFLPLMAIYISQDASFVLVDGVYVSLADPVG